MRSCATKLDFAEQRYSHSEHAYGFSPLCTRSCRTTPDFLEHRYSQYPQRNRFSTSPAAVAEAALVDCDRSLSSNPLPAPSAVLATPASPPPPPLFSYMINGTTSSLPVAAAAASRNTLNGVTNGVTFPRAKESGDRTSLAPLRAAAKSAAGAASSLRCRFYCSHRQS